MTTSTSLTSYIVILNEDLKQCGIIEAYWKSTGDSRLDDIFYSNGRIGNAASPKLKKAGFDARGRT